MATRTKLSRLLTARKPVFGRSGSCSNGGSVLGISKMLYSSSSSSALASNECEAVGSRLIGLHLEILGVKNYVNYRRSLYGEISHKALLVDAVGTFVVPSQPMAQIYRQIGEKYGVEHSVTEILNRYSKAYEQPWGRSRLMPFWQSIVSCSTGCSNSRYFEELYNYYTTNKAWHLGDPEAEQVFKAIRKRVEAEKPNPTIFLKACGLIGVKPEEAVHVGDDRRNDIWGARDAGCDAWLWGSDVYSLKEVAQRNGVHV